MDWLSRQNAFLDCKAKSVRLTHPSGQTIDYSSPRSRNQMHALNVLPLPDLEDILVVRDFPDVFPEELPGMPPDRCVESSWILYQAQPQSPDVHIGWTHMS